MTRTWAYQDALDRLDLLRASKNTRVDADTEGFFENSLESLGYQSSDLHKLKTVKIVTSSHHSSTTAFTESIIRRTRPAWNIGMFMLSSASGSPRERIHLNGKRISEELFTAYFFDILDRLSVNEGVNLDSCTEMPDDLHFITLLALHIFIQENVHATIFEVGAECAHDHLDRLLHPVIIGVLSRDMASDYPSRREIDVPMVIPACAASAIDKLTDISEPISNVVLATTLPEVAGIELGLGDSDAKENAMLAVHIARAFFSVIDPFFKLVYSTPPLPQSFITGLQKARAFVM